MQEYTLSDSLKELHGIKTQDLQDTSAGTLAFLGDRLCSPYIMTM